MTNIRCSGQCFTQINNILYIYNNYNAILFEYNLNTNKYINIIDNNRLLNLFHVCITDNITNLFIIGGYDGVSLQPYHNIQLYDINNNTFDSNFNNLIIPRIDSSCIIISNIMYIIGGWTEYLTKQTNLIEKINLNTLISTLYSSSISLDIPRAKHYTLSDNLNRLWIIAGIDINMKSINDIEIFDPINNTMISKTNPIKYGSTFYLPTLYGVPFYDNINNIMFMVGVTDNNTNIIQYIPADLIGQDAYPTPPPSLPPSPTPYPTPSGQLISEIYDMSLYLLNESLSFTQAIQSTIDSSVDEFFYIKFSFINGYCNNATLSFRFEEIDFAQSTNEYIDIFYPIYPNNLFQHCTGSHDRYCGIYLDCIQRKALPVTTTHNQTDYLFTVLKSAEINQFCTYSINAYLTLNCGPQPAPTNQPTLEPTQSPTDSPISPPNMNVSKTFNLSNIGTTTPMSYTININSDIDNGLDSLFMIKFNFINGICMNPSLTFEFEEIDFAGSTEFIMLYYDLYPNNFIKQCTGAADANCGNWINCVNGYDLGYDNVSDSLTIIALKSADINRFCTYSINANVTITCNPTPEPSVSPTPSPTNYEETYLKTFDLHDTNNNNSNILNDYTINIQSTIDNALDVLFNITFKFINGNCHTPLLSVIFEEIDFHENTEYLQIFYPFYDANNIIDTCYGDQDTNCNHFETCLKYYDLQLNNINGINNDNSITIYLVKSKEINAFCTNSINVNMTISCVNPFYNITCPPTPICNTTSTTTPTTTTTTTATPTLIPSIIPSVIPSTSTTLQPTTMTPTTMLPTAPYTTNTGPSIIPLYQLNVEFSLNFTSSWYQTISSTQTGVIYAYSQCGIYSNYLHVNINNFKQENGFLYSCDVNTLIDATTINEIYFYESQLTLDNLKQPLSQLLKAETYLFMTQLVYNIIKMDTLSPTTTSTTSTPTSTSSTTKITTSIPTLTDKPTTTPTSTTSTTSTPTSIPTTSTSTSTSISTSTDKPTQTPSNCGDATNNDDNNNNDKLMTYMPWLLLGVSVLFNIMLLFALISQRKKIKIIQRNKKDDGTQMVSMLTRAGHNKLANPDFQEITSDASVDYVTMIE